MNYGESSSKKNKRLVFNENNENAEILSREKSQKMEAHLATTYIQYPEEISKYWHENIANWQINYTHNNKSLPLSQPPNSTQMQITNHYKSSD
ncbi:hypothetical protein RCL_jg8161.t1 [Rhizophagus clarus]|uniref:Uncharacterized protein n=1 Tax=Rhizophagus clarus TaxID=94130 RepID=A0A8H3R623_9GLOM|nr:hypothetical protein RCL_jg8161.t1 [Rhizophagus clarus]